MDYLFCLMRGSTDGLGVHDGLILCTTCAHPPAAASFEEIWARLIGGTR